MSTKEDYAKVIKYIMDDYYNDSIRTFSVKEISHRTNVNVEVVRDVLSILEDKKLSVFKLKYKDILKLEQIYDSNLNKKNSLFSVCIALLSFIISFCSIIISIYASEINEWFKIIVYIVLCPSLLISLDYVFKKIYPD